MGKDASLARPVGYRCAAGEVPDAIERLLREHERLADPGESVRHFLGRYSNEEIRVMLGGSVCAVAQRDLPVAAPPHGLEV